MLIAARNGFLVGGGWKNPYITNGLVAMWDGEWNAGLGLHDPNATVWKDLSGNGYDFSPILNPPAWDANAFVGDGTNRKMQSGEISAANSNGATIEVVLHIKSGFQGWYVQNRSTISQNAFNWFQIISYPPSSQQYGFCTLGNQVYVDDRFYIPLDVDFVVAISADGQGTRGYINGSFEENKATNFSANILGGNALCVGAWTNIGGGSEMPMPLGGKIYDIRLYNRALSAAEIAANYAVDKARFNLP